MQAVNDYRAFIGAKSQFGADSGFEPVWIPEFLYPFQSALTGWSVRKGRAALFEDCGLGKTPQYLVWAENVCRYTSGRVLVLTPLAVSPQTVREAEKFGIAAALSRDGSLPERITVTNYERLHHFDAADFAGVVCDESSILKNFAGVRRKAVTEFLRRVRYRLLCTATAAPNDFTELGTSSEAVGDLGHMDMLARFFKNDDGSVFLHGTKYGDMTQKRWRFKPHAESGFWRWVCSWARACRKPSDLGFDDGRFELPELVTNEHRVKALRPAPGRLFDVPAETLEEEREEQRRTVPERCERAAELVGRQPCSIAWYDLRDEGDLLKRLIPDAELVTGSDADERKEEIFLAFAAGRVARLITHPKIGGFGMNWQHCGHQTFFPSHSFEQWYQCVRRSLRYGREGPVVVDVVTTDGADSKLANLRRKADAADAMFARLVGFMNDSLRVGRGGYGDTPIEIPAWLS
jgi:hypothetical protein